MLKKNSNKLQYTILVINTTKLFSEASNTSIRRYEFMWEIIP